jgi:hypothetical protein
MPVHSALRSRRSLLSSLVAAGLVAALAAPATAAEPVTVDHVEVVPPVVVLKNTDENLFDVYLGATVTSGEIDRLGFDGRDPRGGTWNSDRSTDGWVLLDEDGDRQVWATAFVLPREAPPGAWTARGFAAVEGGAEVASDQITFQVKRNTVVSGFNATEPVKRGASTTVSGTLKRLDPAARTYVGYAGKTVSIQFKAKGTTSYRTVATVKTSSKGAFSKRVVASKDGVWRAVFAGTAYYVASTSAWDYVDVR